MNGFFSWNIAKCYWCYARKLQKVCSCWWVFFIYLPIHFRYEHYVLSQNRIESHYLSVKTSAKDFGSRHLQGFFFYAFLLLNYLFIYFLLYNIVFLVLPYIDMNLPWIYMCSPSWTSLPLPSPSHLSESSQCTSPKHPVSCIEPGLAIRFAYDNLQVSMPFSKIILPLPSPTEFKRLFYTSVFLLLSCI